WFCLDWAQLFTVDRTGGWFAEHRSIFGRGHQYYSSAAPRIGSIRRLAASGAGAWRVRCCAISRRLFHFTTNHGRSGWTPPAYDHSSGDGRDDADGWNYWRYPGDSTDSGLARPDVPVCVEAAAGAGAGGRIEFNKSVEKKTFGSGKSRRKYRHAQIVPARFN